MKRFLIIIFFTFQLFLLNSQTIINMMNGNYQEITASTNDTYQIYDDGGASGLYSNNVYSMLTIKSPNNKITITGSYNIQQGDFLYFTSDFFTDNNNFPNYTNNIIFSTNNNTSGTINIEVCNSIRIVFYTDSIGVDNGFSLNVSINNDFTNIITFSNITSHSALVSWTNTSYSSWIVEYGPQGFAAGTGTTITTNNNNTTLENLDFYTIYTVYVYPNINHFYSCNYANFRTSCINITPTNITTDSAIINVTNYDSTSVWTLVLTNLSTYNVTTINPCEFPVTLSNLSWGTSYIVRIYESDNPVNNCNSIYFITQCVVYNLAVDSITTHSAEISWQHQDSSMNEFNWIIEYGEYGFPQGTGNTITLTSSSFENSVIIDNLEWGTNYQYYIYYEGNITHTACNRNYFTTECLVNNITTNNITTSTAELSWNTPDNINFWTIEYGISGFTPGTGNTIATTNLYATLENLHWGTEYQYYIYKTGAAKYNNCNNGYFTTLCLIQDINIVNIELYSAEIIWTCPDIINSYTIEYGIAGFQPGTGLTIETNSNSITLTDLNWGTNYEFYIYETGDPFYYSLNNTTGEENILVHSCNFSTFTTLCLIYGVSATEITNNSALISWFSYDNSITSWIIEYGYAGFPQGQGNIITSDVLSVTLTNLPAASYYDYYIYTNGETSYNNCNLFNFSTLCEEMIEYCFNFTDLQSPIVTCRYGHFYNPNQNIGVIDNGPQSISSRHTIHSDVFETDPRTGGQLSCVPLCSQYSVRLGNWNTGSEAESITYEYYVNATENKLLMLKYAAVMEDPGHPALAQPRFTINIFNEEGQAINEECYSADFIASSSLGWNNYSGVLWKDWTTISIDLEELDGQTIKIQITTYDCSYGGDYGYAYFTLNCGGRKVLTTDQCGDLDSITFTAPQGFHYRWYSAENEENTLSTFFQLTVGGQGQYFCECSSISNPSCKFTITAMAGPRFPLAGFNFESNCSNEIHFYNTSTVSSDGINPNGLNEECETAFWDFGDGTTSTEYNPTHIYQSGGIFNVRLVVGLANNQCTDTIIIPVNVFYLNNSIEILNGNCNEECNYTAIINVVSVSSPYTYDFQFGYDYFSGSELVSGLCSGNYTLTITDINNCNSIVNFSINQVIPFQINNIVTQNKTCHNTNDGFIHLNITEGSSAFYFSWSDGFLSLNRDFLDGGDYTLIIEDINNCFFSQNFHIFSPNELTANLQADTTICEGETITIEAIVSGGTPPYTYYWSEPPYNQSFNIGGQSLIYTLLSNSSFRIYVIDANGCISNTDDIFINVSPKLLINNINLNNVSCYQFCDASAQINFQGGVEPFVFTGDVNQENNINLCSGSYNFTIIDSYGCSISNEFNITQPEELVISLNSGQIICEGETVILQANATEGTPNYFYHWSETPNPQSFFTDFNIREIVPHSTTTYFVYVTDEHNCISNLDSATIIVSPYIIIDSIITFKDKCESECNGTAQIIFNGGTQPYNYSWTSNNNFINNLCNGNYTVTISDIYGCTATSNFQITQPPLLSYSTYVKHSECYGSDGYAQIFVQGGEEPYSYIWYDGTTTSSINLSAGNYTVTVYDANHCRLDIDFNIQEPDEIIISQIFSSTICYGQNINLVVEATGGTPYEYGYNFHWNSSIGAEYYSNKWNISPTQTAEYYVTVTDRNGCTKSIEPITVTVYPQIEIISTIANKNLICPYEDIEIQVQITGGNNGPYLMRLQNGQIVGSPFTINPEKTGWIVVYVEDMCSSTSAKDSVFIEVRPKVNVNFAANQTKGCPPLTVEFNDSTAGFFKNYFWTFGENHYSKDKNTVFVYAESGVFDVTLEIEDDYGCKQKKIIKKYINIFPKPKASFKFSPEIVTLLNPQIEFTDLSEGATKLYWQFGDGYSAIIKNPIHKFIPKIASYQVCLVAENNFNCVDTSCRPLEIEDIFTFYAPTAFTPNSDGNNDCFKICGHFISENNFQLTIHDRWGNIVFKTDTYISDTEAATNCVECSNGSWNGKNKNTGNYCMEGTYIWKCYLQDKYGNRYEYSGTVELIR